LEFAGLSDLDALRSEVGETGEGDMTTSAHPIKDQQAPVQSGRRSANEAEWQRNNPEISTPVGTEDGRVVFAHVRFDSGVRKEFVASLKKYLEYLESTLQSLD
jgi:hypothetical protein